MRFTIHTLSSGHLLTALFPAWGPRRSPILHIESFSMIPKWTFLRVPSLSDPAKIAWFSCLLASLGGGGWQGASRWDLFCLSEYRIWETITFSWADIHLLIWLDLWFTHTLCQLVRGRCKGLGRDCCHSSWERWGGSSLFPLLWLLDNLLVNKWIQIILFPFLRKHPIS